MGCHSTEQNNKDFVPHEIKTYQRKGDLVRSEYERLNPDGTVTKTIAYGDCKQGLKYRTFQMGLDGAVREIAAEYFTPSKTVTAATQQHQQQQQYDQQQQQKLHQQQLEYQQQQQYLQQLHEHKLKLKELQFQKQQQEARQQLQEARQKQSLETKQEPRKTYTFTVEPKESHDPSVRTFRVRPVKIEQQEKPTEEKTEKVSPWWLDQFKDIFSEFKGEEKVPEKPVEPERKPFKSLLNWFDDDFFFSSPLKNSLLQRPKWTESFDLLGDSFFNRPLLGFSRALLEDF